MGREMYCVRRGLVEVIGDDDITVVATLGPGAYFGEVWKSFVKLTNVSIRTSRMRYTPNLQQQQQQQQFSYFSLFFWHFLNQILWTLWSRLVLSLKSALGGWTQFVVRLKVVIKHWGVLLKTRYRYIDNDEIYLQDITFFRFRSFPWQHG